MASARKLGGTMAGGGSASTLLASGRSEGEGRARAEGSRAFATSSRPARGAVRAIRAHGGHAAAGLCCRSAMTGLKVTFQRSSSPTDRRTLTPINS